MAGGKHDGYCDGIACVGQGVVRSENSADAGTAPFRDRYDFFATGMTVFACATDTRTTRRGRATCKARCGDVELTDSFTGPNDMRSRTTIAIETSRSLLLFAISTIQTGFSLRTVARWFAAGFTSLILRRDVTNEPHPKRRKKL